MSLTAWFIPCVLGPICALSLACAGNRQQVQIDRAREQLKGLHQYEAPTNFREQIEAYFDAALGGAARHTAMFADPHGAVVCGHVKAGLARGGHAGYQPFGAVFDRAGSLRWVRIYQPYQGMYVTSFSNPRPTDEDVAIAIACDIPLIF